MLGICWKIARSNYSDDRPVVREATIAADGHPRLLRDRLIASARMQAPIGYV